MNKHTIIVITASVVIAATFVFSAFNIYAAEQIQFVGNEKEGFSYFNMINSEQLSVCNSLPFYVTLSKINMIMVFDKKEIGIYRIQDVVLSPFTISNIKGNFKSENFDEAQYYAFHFDGEFSESIPIRTDSMKFSIISEIDTPIIGIIPYTVNKQYSGQEFWNMMNEKNGKVSC